MDFKLGKYLGSYICDHNFESTLQIYLEILMDSFEYDPISEKGYKLNRIKFLLITVVCVVNRLLQELRAPECYPLY